jgi:prepilin-type N-terminal cleavage/methylation domain-containing protein
MHRQSEFRSPPPLRGRVRVSGRNVARGCGRFRTPSPACPHRGGGSRRPGFTLIEMLVVILIIMLLAALVVAFMPGVSTRQQSERAGMLLRTSLNQMRQNALRDGRASGLRLIPNSTAASGGTICTSPQFIQKPDDFGGGIMQAAGFSTSALCQNANGVGSVTLQGNIDLSGSPILPGDTIDVAGSGEPHTISAVNGAALTLASPFLNLSPINPNAQAAQLTTSQYRIMRAPRVMIGEPPIMLPQDIGIDLSLGGVFASGTLSAGGQPTPFTAGLNDVLFAPSGQIIGDGNGPAYTGCDAVVLWVHDTIVTNPTQAFPVLIVIYGKTGFITQQPVDPNGASGGDYYSFIRASLASGM